MCLLHMVESTASRWRFTSAAGLALLMIIMAPILLSRPTYCEGFSIERDHQNGGPRIHRVYTGNDGQSHMESFPLDVNPFLDAEGAHGQATELLQSTGIVFRTSPVGYELDWHTAPRRQLMILLRGRVELEVGSGARLQCRPGDVVLAEDTTGQGHITRVVGQEERFYAIVPLQDGQLLRAEKENDGVFES